MKSFYTIRNSAFKLGTQVCHRPLKVLIYIGYYDVIDLLNNYLATS